MEKLYICDHVNDPRCLKCSHSIPHTQDHDRDGFLCTDLGICYNKDGNINIENVKCVEYKE